MKNISDFADTEEYLRSHAVIDGRGNMDGSMVPLSVAMIAIQQVIEGKLKHNSPTWIVKNNEQV